MVDLTIRASSAAGIFQVDDPGSPFFSTDFDVAVGRDDSGSSKVTAFTGLGFKAIKDETTNETQAAGWISTVTSIPGNAGLVIPCASGRALRREARPTLLGQGDSFLEIDPSGVAAQGSFPAEMWWEYWVCPNRTGSEMSEFSENKLWYWLEAGDANGQYSNDTDADCGRANVRNYLNDPVTGAVHQTGYTIGSYTYELLANASGSGPRLYVAAQAADAPHRMTPNYQNGAREWIRPNEWTKVRHHKSIGQSPGRYRIWTRSQGATDDDFALILDTAVAGVTYDTVAEDWPGSRAVRLGTTTGPTDGSGLDHYLYLTRLRMATTQAGLGFQRSH